MRIEPLQKREMSWTLRPVLAAMRRMFGKELTPYRVMARRPAILWGMTLANGALMRAKTLPAQLKTLASIRAAQMIGCPF